MRTICRRSYRLLTLLRPSMDRSLRMRIALVAIGTFLLMTTAPAHAGKNAGGAMVVHTDDRYLYSGICDWFDHYYPDIVCSELDTRTDVDLNTAAMIWFIAAFPDDSNPGVTVVYFGHDHSMPLYYHSRWGYCGPPGTLEIPDTGWPDAPATAGNSVAFGSPVAGDILFPFYYFYVWGETGWHYCTARNPVGGYAAYVDDSNPPELDEICSFGCAYYGTDEGYNDCPQGGDLPGACCFESGDCTLTLDLDECLAAGGYDWLGSGIPCDPNPCPQPGACCYEDGSCEVWPETDCVDQGGTWYGDEYEDCDPNPCPLPPTGACCYGSEECIVLTELECYDLPDDYLWLEGEVCEPNPCPPTAIEEASWGRIKAGYRE